MPEDEAVSLAARTRELAARARELAARTPELASLAREPAARARELASRARESARELAGLARDPAAGARGPASRSRPRLVVLIDGRSGTGKTTLGDALAAELDAQIVHLDDVYPGWDGLRAASEAVVTDVLGPASGHTRWDWSTSQPAGWTAVDPERPIVIEGCGALSRASAPLASLRVWLEADDALRRRRAIERDGEVFAKEWERWAAQEEAFIATEDPVSLADVVVRT